MFTNPSVMDFKTYFFRDFPYGTEMNNVQDRDITNAISDAAFNFNPGLFGSQQEYTTGYLLLSAHFLVTNLRNSSQGIAGQYSFLQNSKSVGNVSESLAIPQKFLDNPEFSMLAKTNYGAKYMQLLIPRLIGPIFASARRAAP